MPDKCTSHTADAYLQSQRTELMKMWDQLENSALFLKKTSVIIYYFKLLCTKEMYAENRSSRIYTAEKSTDLF